MRPFSINIIGAGSIGHLWAIHLKQMKVDIRLYSKSKKPPQIVELYSKNTTTQCHLDYHGFSDWRKSDLVIISVKANYLKNLCEVLTQHTALCSTTILMMNGMGIVKIVKDIFPRATIYQASTTHGARLAENKLIHTGSGETLIGLEQQDQLKPKTPPLMANIVRYLNSALPSTKWSKNHKQVLWRKLLINSIINPLTCVHNVNNGKIVADTIINKQAKNLTLELAPLIAIYLPGENWQSIFEKVESVANQTYTNISSMRQDILAGRLTEIDFISGYVINKAKKHGVHLPDHEKLINRVKLLESDSYSW